MAQRLGLDESFHTGGHRVAKRLCDLVTWAEGDGVFGLDDHEIHTFQVVGGSDAAVGGYILTVQPPFPPQLCFGTLTETELLGPDAHGVDAAVHALTVLASHVTALVSEHMSHLATASPTRASHPDRPTRPGPGQPLTRPGLASTETPLGSQPPTPPHRHLGDREAVDKAIPPAELNICPFRR